MNKDKIKELEAERDFLKKSIQEALNAYWANLRDINRKIEEARSGESLDMVRDIDTTLIR